ncbi:MAG TPA: hydroxyethylthiazole kinase [Bacteroidales bacterium]|nr:hydroxyethylthiazole kinase [Bacteroidales bacterium]
MELKEQLKELYEQKFEGKYPLVCFLTNYVTVLDLVDMCIHSGGSPVLTDEISEAHEMVEYSGSDAVVMNFGTINREYLDIMTVTGACANRAEIPIILDPAAVTASSFRKYAISHLLKEVRISILKGNLGEIKYILGYETQNKGIDSFEDERGAEKYCTELAEKLGCVVVMTGKTDIITDGRRIARISNGNARLKKICGAGSSVASIMATYSGLTQDYFLSAVLGAAVMGVASEVAEERMTESDGIRTFKTLVHDAVSMLKTEELMNRMNLTST